MDGPSSGATSAASPAPTPAATPTPTSAAPSSNSTQSSATNQAAPTPSFPGNMPSKIARGFVDTFAKGESDEVKNNICKAVDAIAKNGWQKFIDDSRHQAQEQNQKQGEDKKGKSKDLDGALLGYFQMLIDAIRAFREKEEADKQKKEETDKQNKQAAPSGATPKPNPGNTKTDHTKEDEAAKQAMLAQVKKELQNAAAANSNSNAQTKWEEMSVNATNDEANTEAAAQTQSTEGKTATAGENRVQVGEIDEDDEEIDEVNERMEGEEPDKEPGEDPDYDYMDDDDDQQEGVENTNNTPRNTAD